MFAFLNAFVMRRRDDENGASAVEYGLLVTGIAGIIVIVLFVFGGVVKGTFSKSCSTYATKAAPSSAASCTSS